MTVHFSFTHNRSHALAYEVARQFKDSRSLRLVGSGLLEYAAVLSGANALSGVESAFAGSPYPLPGPSKVLQECAAGKDADPYWSNLTMTLRLMAGAMGIAAIPTGSLFGSDLMTGKGRARVDTPFGELTLIEAIRPDVTFLHVPIADTDGNCVVFGPYGEDLWGAWAADHVVVSAEEVVSVEELRRHAPHYGFPGARVDAVVHAPYGAHPQGQYVWDSSFSVATYREDYAFRREFREVSSDPARLRAWLDEWVFGSTHDEYVRKLGVQRLSQLAVTAPGPVESSFESASSGDVGAPTVDEKAATVAARTIGSAVGAYDSIICGIGLSHLAAWLARRTSDPSLASPALVAETGVYGFTPSTDDPYLFSYDNSRASVVHSDYVRMLGVLAGPAARRCLTVVAAGQVDRVGAINSSTDAEGNFLVGSGGANDLCSGASDLLIVTKMAPRRMVEEVTFTTGSSSGLIGVATDVGLLQRSPEGELVLVSVMADSGAEQDVVDYAISRCGWDLKVSPHLTRLDPPTRLEIEILRSYANVA
jgi:acyl CoA:acetate/3-ketoacid CoA transferase alpha subunit/acyl CoA:acetate/3-ketoacid CoA transferase beta subunit